eukprot:1615190-Pyramimonas_sp.AAC.1
MFSNHRSPGLRSAGLRSVGLRLGWWFDQWESYAPGTSWRAPPGGRGIGARQGVCWRRPPPPPPPSGGGTSGLPATTAPAPAADAGCSAPPPR